MLRFLIMWTIMSGAFAYSFTSDFQKGLYWKSFPVRIHHYSENLLEREGLNRLLNQAIQIWEEQLADNVWDQAGTITLDQILSENNIRWSNNFGVETGHDPVSTLAITVRYAVGTFFARTEIILNAGNTRLRNNEGGLLLSTILHELGHTIGLDHSNGDTVMAAQANGVTSLQLDDIEGGQAAVDDMKHKQAIGYVSPFSSSGSSSNSKFGGCGTVEFTSRDKIDPPGGFFFSLVLGLMLAFFSRRITSAFLPVRI